MSRMRCRWKHGVLALLVLLMTACHPGRLSPLAARNTPAFTYEGDVLFTDGNSLTAAQRDRVMEAVFQAAIGATETAEEVRFTVERGYEAASGYQCRRVRFERDQETTRLICRRGEHMVVVHRI